jgi:hypothetical protein
MPGKLAPRFKAGKELLERLNLGDAPAAEPGPLGASGR